MERAARAALTDFLNVRPHETVLVVTDQERRHIGDAFLNAAREIARAELIEMPTRTVSNWEPPADVASAMREHDVVICPTSTSLSHTKARIAASAAGARVVTLSGVTQDMMERCVDVDYQAICGLCNRIIRAIAGKTVRVRTVPGTDLTFRTAPDELGKELLHNKGSGGGLPWGEADARPEEGTANGVFVVDVGMWGPYDEPVTITVKDGLAEGITGGKMATAVRDALEPFGRAARNIAEFAVGTNPKARVTDRILEGEKALGTAHIALGNNEAYGGTVDVGIHVDGVFRNPTVEADGKLVVDAGEVLV